MRGFRNRGERRIESKKTVLVVDDDRGMLECLRARIEDARFDVVTAAGGREALEALAERTPDAVILDANMPGMNGLSVCEAIRSVEASADVPVIFLSGAEAPSLEYVERCAQVVGATRFLRKPCDPRVLLDLLETLTSEREADVLRVERDPWWTGAATVHWTPARRQRRRQSGVHRRYGAGVEQRGRSVHP